MASSQTLLTDMVNVYSYLLWFSYSLLVEVQPPVLQEHIDWLRMIFVTH